MKGTIMTDWLDLTQEQRLWTIRNDNGNYADTPEDIQCPWCSENQNFDFENVSYDDDDTTEYTCINEECEKKFDVHTSVSYTWATELPQDYLIEEAKKQVPVTDLLSERSTPASGDLEAQSGAGEKGRL